MVPMIIGFLCNFITASLHPFHVSVCEIYHNEKQNSLEISIKFFIDDFELSIQKSGYPEFNLTEKKADEIDPKPVELYLAHHFKIKLDSKLIKLKLLGFEHRNETILCYLEAKGVKAIDELELTNTAITEVYADQINLAHVQINNEMKSVKTNAIKNVETVIYTTR